MQSDASPHIETPEAIPSTNGVRLTLEKKDVGDLDKVLREYYLSQVGQIQPRSDRKRARKLLENHLVLPKSRQRTSKDAAYINETLGIEDPLLVKLEQYRLIRRLNKSGRNPIYEISHDSLVEPILAERRNREAVMRFFKKYGKWIALLLVFLFAGGMIFENTFNVMDDQYALWGNSHGQHKTVSLNAAEGIIVGLGPSNYKLHVPFGEVEDYFGSDSLTLEVGVDIHAIDKSSATRRGYADTLKVNMGAITLPITPDQAQALITAQRDTALPVNVTAPIGNYTSGRPLMASVAGTAILKMECDDPDDRGLDPASTDLNGRKNKTVKKHFGTLSVKASENRQTIRLDTIINLADLLTNDKVAYDVLRDHKLHLTYDVAVQPVPKVAPTTVVEYVPVSGIEVQYADGSKRLISPDAASSGQRTTPPAIHTVKPGETLWGIAKNNNTTMAELRKLNNLPDNTVKVGQVLKLR